MLKTRFVLDKSSFFVAESEFVIDCNLMVLDKSFLNKMFIFPFLNLKNEIQQMWKKWFVTATNFFGIMA
jgi:hypothetical protein